MSIRYWSKLSKSYILMILILSQVIPVMSQEMWGIVNSNYAGSNGIAINPSSIVNSKLYMDINIATADFFVDNNIVYIHREDYRLFKMFGPHGIIPSYGKNEYPVDRFSNKDLKNAYLHLRFQGPSFMLVKGDHAFALYTAYRTINSVRRISYEIANFAYEGLKYPPQYNINYNDFDFYVTNLNWTELGITYAGVIFKQGMNRLTGGITVKYLMGFAGGYMKANNVDYIVLNDSTINFRNLDAELGFSIPVNYENNNFPDDGKLIKGKGFGIDIGFNYLKTKKGYQRKKYNSLCRQSYPDYYYKVGVSLLDVGRIKFTENTEQHVYDNVSSYWEEIDTLHYYNLDQIARLVSEQFYGNPDASLRNDEISIILPSAISAQVDYQFYKDWYINGTAILPVRLGQVYLHRPAQISVTPRYESRLYEVSLPVSLYDFRYPRIGIAARIAFFTIGTNKLRGFFGLSDFTGLDIYASIKINFNKGYCARYKKKTPCQNSEYGVQQR